MNVGERRNDNARIIFTVSGSYVQATRVAPAEPRRFERALPYGTSQTASDRCGREVSRVEKFRKRLTLAPGRNYNPACEGKQCNPKEVSPRLGTSPSVFI
jgi:hypothetical protein